MNQEDRHCRQRRLTEIGDAGQARLAEANLTVAASPAAAFELAYLERAGVGRATITTRKRPEAFAHQRHFRFAEPARLGSGAWHALRQIAAVVTWESS